MVQPVRRRFADPQSVQNIWEAVSSIRQQKQIPNTERISRYLQRTHQMAAEEVESQLQQTVADDLVQLYTAVSHKGSKVGQEQDGYKLPELEGEQEEKEQQEEQIHDYYCFDCHQAGEVLECSECWRVYHTTCTEEEHSGDTFICAVCADIRKKPRMKRKELNRLLGYTIQRLKDKSKELLKFGGKDDQVKIKNLVFQNMDLNAIEMKTRERKYKYLEQFYADCRNILHNTFIVYGDTSNLGNLAKMMIRDCKYDLDEIRQCKDCYFFSNAKPKEWFCQPCRPPHELVYAKQKGFSFWPAKVIKVTKEGYDVRFFGGWHQRALIPASSVKPISVNIKSLTIKRTAGFVKACEELKRHQTATEAMEAEEEEDVDGASDEEQGEIGESGMPELTIRHKKFRKRQRDEDLEVTSTNVEPGQAAEPMEDVNLVTSSEDNVLRTVEMADVAIQTSKKLAHGGKMISKGVQAETKPVVPETLTLHITGDGNYEEVLDALRKQVSDEYEQDKIKALSEFEERMLKEFEEDKQIAVNRAMGGKALDLERVKKQAENKARDHFLEEMKKLTTKHKAEISATKKKQWCYNCEEEAMYHCCWNTSYCSNKCQQEHWHREHKRMCRRKRS